MTTYYLAAPWTRRDVAAELSVRLEEAGFHATHRWWQYEAGDEDHARLADLAALDLVGVTSCDDFIVLNLEKSEGKAVESGLALAGHLRFGHPQRLIGVGPRGSNIFQHLRVWEWVERPKDLVRYLQTPRG